MYVIHVRVLLTLTVLYRNYSYVSSNDGLVFEVNTNSYSLLRVWDLQCVTINSITFVTINSITCVTINSNTDDNTVNSNDDSCCVTASADGVVRVWSSEFTMVVMETDLESPVMSVGVGGANTVTCVTQVSERERLFEWVICFRKRIT